MAVQALGYLGVRAQTLEDWVSYGTHLLGLQLADQSRSSLAFRMDDRKQRLLVAADEAEDGAFFGWEMADAEAVEALAGSLDAAGVNPTRLSAASAQQRRVKDAIRFLDPAGNRLEAFFGAELSSEPFRPGRSISGFRTGPLGMGHVVLTVERLAPVLAFYIDVLGFRVSDFMVRPFTAYFLHTNSRHHSLALIETGRRSLHHLMLELFSLDDVGQGYDLALLEPNRVATTLGRHTNDFMTSFYSTSPSKFLIEYGWGGRVIEPDTWKPSEIMDGPSLWGHDRAWLSAEGQAHARDLRLQAAAKGLRAPLQVLEGNFALSSGICPWWDGQRRPGPQLPDGENGTVR